MWEALRTLRRKLAQEHSVPPYVIFPDATLLEMLRSQPRSLSDMAQVSGVGARKLERYGQAFLDVLTESEAAPAAPAAVVDLRHELVTLARAGMTPAQIARQLDCTEKNVYSLLAEAIGRQQLSLEQALDLPEELMGEIQDAFLEGDGELPPVAELAERFDGRVPAGVLHCVRAALQAELEV
ncbi:ATP-dependent DNA helicase RecQ [compost metagenome]